MRISSGTVETIRLDPGGKTVIQVSCPPQVVPAAGQYLLAGSAGSLLPEPLFLWQATPQGFLAAPGAGSSWDPGTALTLRGPLGRGFQLPAGVRRLALIALGETAARLLPLVQPALAGGADVALFGAGPLPPLPSLLEVAPLSALPQALTWADFLALDLPLEGAPDWRKQLGILPERGLPCQGQALVCAPMPCGALAECGVCALETRRGWRLACKDGPVFRLEDL